MSSIISSDHSRDQNRSSTRGFGTDIQGRDNGDKHTEGDSSWDKLIENTYNSVNNGLNGVLLLMSKRNDRKSRNFYGTVLSFAIDTFQLLSFVVNTQTGSVPALVSIFKFFNFHEWLFDSFGYTTTMGIAVALVTIELANVAFVGYSWSQNKFHSIWSVKFLRNTTLLLVGNLFIPIISVFANILNCANLFTSYETATDPVISSLDSSICVSVSPVIGLLSFALIFLSLIVSVSFHDGSPTSQGATSRAHSRVEMATLLINTIASIGAALILPHPTKSSTVLLAWQAFLFLSHAYLALLLIWFQPYYNSSILKLKTGLVMLLAWTAGVEVVRITIEQGYGDPRASVALTSSTALAVSNTTNAIASVTSVGANNVGTWLQVYTAFNAIVMGASSLLMFPVAHFLINARIRRVRQISFSMCRNVYEFELKARIELRPVVEFLHNHWDNDNGTLSGNSLKACTDEHRKKIRQVAEAYNEALTNFESSSVVCMFITEFYASFLPSNEATLQIRRVILEAERRKISFDVAFSLLRMRSHIKEYVTKGQDIMTYVMSTQYERDANDADQKCCVLLLRFWDSLRQKHPDITKARRMAVRIGEHTQRGKKAFSRLTQLHPHNIGILRKHAGFLADVCNQDEQAQRLITKADFLSRNVNDRGGGRQQREHAETGLNANAAVMTFGLSDSKHHFGEILTTNAHAGSILNELSSGLVGKQMGDFLLPPWSTFLFEVVHDFLANGTSPYMYKPLSAYMSNPDCFEVRLRFIPFTSDGMEYTVYAEFTKLATQSSCYLICTAAGELLGMTSTCREVMEDMSDEWTGDAPLNAVFSQFDPTNPRMQSVPGMSVALQDPCHSLKNMTSHVTLLSEECDKFYGITNYKVHLKPHDQAHAVMVSSGTFRRLDGDVVPGFENNNDSIGYGRVETHDQQVEPQGWSSFRAGYDWIGEPQTTLESVVENGEDEVKDVFPSNCLLTRNNSEPSFPGDVLQSVRRTSTTFGTLSKVRKSNSFAKRRSMSDGDEEDTNSVNSGASGISQGTVATVTTLRVSLISQSTTSRLSPMFARLHRLYALTILLVAILSLTTHVVQNASMHQYESIANKVGEAGLRRYMLKEIQYRSFQLYLLSKGVKLDIETEETVREKLRSAGAKLHSLDKDLFDAREIFPVVRTTYLTP